MEEVNFVEVTIASGESLSEAVDLGQGESLVGIQMPGTWTTADLTFAGSIDGGRTFGNIYDGNGTSETEVTVPADAGQVIRLDPADWVLFRHLKVRSGTSGTPVAQGGDRTIRLAKRAI
jgi:hypothetical protein